MFVAAGAWRCNLCGFDTGWGQTPALRAGENILIFWNNDILRGNRSVYQLCFILVKMT